MIDLTKGNIPRFGIITPPIGKAGISVLSNMTSIISEFSNPVYVVTSELGVDYLKNNSKIKANSLKYREMNNFFYKILNHLFIQIQIAQNIKNYRKNVELWIFILDAHSYIIPVLFAKILQKKVVFMISASIPGTRSQKKDILPNIFIYFEKINFRLSNLIILYTKNLIDSWNLQQYREKIIFAHHHFIDVEKFKISKLTQNRDKTIGFIGRFSQEKGIINFIESIPIIIQTDPEIKFLIIGEGILNEKILNYIEKRREISNNVKISGWTKHEELPEILNQIKILVIPSFSEGLPNIMLEAMACGCIVIANSVGSIPDVIKNEYSGFLLDDNSPESIAKKVIDVSKFKNLDLIIENEKREINKNFIRKSAIESFKLIFERI